MTATPYYSGVDWSEAARVTTVAPRSREEEGSMVGLSRIALPSCQPSSYQKGNNQAMRQETWCVASTWCRAI